MLFWCWPCTATCYCHQISKDNSVMLLWHYARSLEQYLDHVSLGLYSYKWHKVYSLSSVYGFIAMMNYFPISAHINYLLRSGLIKNKIYSGDQTLWTSGPSSNYSKNQTTPAGELTSADQSWPEWRTDRWITTLSCLQSADDDLFTASHLSFDVKNLKIDGPLLF